MRNIFSKFMSTFDNKIHADWPIQKLIYDFQADLYVDLELGANDALMNVCA